MPLDERDEYAERHYRGPFLSALLAWALWLLATGVGIAGGRALGLALDQAVYVSSPFYLGVLVLRGALGGAVIGAAQGLVLLPLVHWRGYLSWVVASAASWAARSILLFLISNYLVEIFSGFVPVGLALAAGVGGLVVGGAMGLIKGYVLRDHLWHVALWVVASIMGAAIGRVIAATGITLGWVDNLVAVTVVEGVVWAAVTGAIVASQLRRHRAASKALVSPKSPHVEVLLQVGQPAEVLPGLFLSIERLEVSSGAIVWQGSLRNGKNQPLSIAIEPRQMKISDSTSKPYAVSHVDMAGVAIPTGQQVPIMVQATILPYSPIPPAATYLELAYTSDRQGTYIFRQSLREVGTAHATSDPSHS